MTSGEGNSTPPTPTPFVLLLEKWRGLDTFREKIAFFRNVFKNKRGEGRKVHVE